MGAGQDSLFPRVEFAGGGARVPQPPVFVEAGAIRAIGFAARFGQHVPVEFQDVYGVVCPFPVDCGKVFRREKLESVHDLQIEKFQRLLLPRIDQTRRAPLRRRDRRAPAAGGVDQSAAAYHREPRALATVARPAGEQVVLPYESAVWVKILRRDMFDLVAGGVLAITAAPCADAHFRELAANDVENPIALSVVTFEESPPRLHPLRIAACGIDLLLIRHQAMLRRVRKTGIVQMQHPAVNPPSRPCGSDCGLSSSAIPPIAAVLSSIE